MNFMKYYAPASTIHGDGAMNVVSQEVKQLYNDTCAIKSQQLILEDFGITISEDDLVAEAMQNGWYNNGTSPAHVGNLLESHGIGVTQYENANVFNLVNELSLGHKVIVGVDSGELWKDDNIITRIFDTDSAADHALIVSGIDTSDPDNVKVILTDPGTGDLLKEYKLDEFIDAWKDSNCLMVSTNVAPDNIFASFNNMMPGLATPIEHLPMIGEMPYDVFYDNLAFLNPELSLPSCVFDDVAKYLSGNIDDFSSDTLDFFNENSIWEKWADLHSIAPEII